MRNFTQAHADNIHPREKRRLRRNVITWQGRLERGSKMLQMYREDLAARDFSFHSEAELKQLVEQAEQGVADDRAKLAHAEAEMYAALEAGKRGEHVPFNGAKKLVSA